MPLKNIIGDRFGKLLVIDRAKNMANGTAMWVCRCDCGQHRTVRGAELRDGRRKSCGCASPRFTTERLRTHGKSRSKTYLVWAGMKSRCSEKVKGKSKRLYFDKGLRVCDRWQVFQNFLEDMGECPPSMTIDRIDGDKGYEPSNCRWATYVEQANNTSRNRIISFRGQEKTVAEWAKAVGIKPNTLLYRFRRGMPPEVALTPHSLLKKDVDRL